MILMLSHDQRASIKDSPTSKKDGASALKATGQTWAEARLVRQRQTAAKSKRIIAYSKPQTITFPRLSPETTNAALRAFSAGVQV
jgi:hypothetical protein